MKSRHLLLHILYILYILLDTLLQLISNPVNQILQLTPHNLQIQNLLNLILQLALDLLRW